MKLLLRAQRAALIICTPIGQLLSIWKYPFSHFNQLPQIWLLLFVGSFN